MNIPLRHSYRLAARGGAGLSCDELGLALGGVELARMRSDGEGVARCETRSPAEVAQILQVAYGSQPDAVVLRLHRGLRRTAAWIAAGDLARAGMEAVMLGLPDVAPAAMAKLADFEKGANTAWETEARVPAGQPEGGQWTTGGGASSAAKPPSNASAEPRSPGRPADTPSASPTHPPETGTGATVSSDTGAVDTPHGGSLIPASTAGAVVGGRGMAEDFALPEDVARLGRAGLLVFAATLLDQAGAAAARTQVANAIARFGLDPSRPADVMAASAYVWSRYQLPWHTSAQFTGPTLDAASEAVLRCVLVNPGAFPAMLQGSSPQAAKAASLIIGAADVGLIDYAAESRARPPGVAPELQTTNRAAQKAIADQLKTGRLAVHHLVAACIWGKQIAIAELAHEAGWMPDVPSNLIALPRDPAAQAEFHANYGQVLPVHRGPHPRYDAETDNFILSLRSKFPEALTPLQARAILDQVARDNRGALLAGRYGLWVKVGQ